MHHYVATVLVELFNQRGIVTTQIEQIAAPLQAETLLSAGEADQLYGAAVALQAASGGAGHLGWELGERLEMVSMGMFGYALMTTATVGELLNLLLRYSRAILPSIQVSSASYTYDTQAAQGLALEVKADHLPEPLGHFYTEVLFSALYHNLQMLAPQAVDRVVIVLPYPEPPSAVRHADVVQYGGDRASIQFDGELLAMPIDTSDPLAQSVFRRHCDRMLDRDSHAGLVSERVKHELIACRSHFPTCAEVAVRLNLSESTLQRKLAREGTRFQPLLDQVRHRLAEEYLTGTDLPVAEIAALLDFDNAANFRRALRRWAGVTPSELRGRA